MEKIQITLKRSIIGQHPSVRKTVRALKLGKIHSSSVFEKTLSIEGMVKRVQHLVEINKL